MWLSLGEDTFSLRHILQRLRLGIKLMNLVLHILCLKCSPFKSYSGGGWWESTRAAVCSLHTIVTQQWWCCTQAACSVGSECRLFFRSKVLFHCRESIWQVLYFHAFIVKQNEHKMLLATKCYGKLPNRFSLLLLFFHMFIEFFPKQFYFIK